MKEKFQPEQPAEEVQQTDSVDAAHADQPPQAETRDEEMERLRETAEQADKRVLMAQAEAENFRKRMRRDYEEQLKYAALPLVTDLLEVRDNLIRALEASASSSDASGILSSTNNQANNPSPEGTMLAASFSPLKV